MELERPTVAPQAQRKPRERLLRPLELRHKQRFEHALKERLAMDPLRAS